MKNAKRYLAVVLSFALFLALPLAFTQEAAAASGTKVTQPSKIIWTSTNPLGDTSTTSTSVTAFAYDKKGLNTLTATQNDKGQITSKGVSTYNKSGYETSYTAYNGKDEPTYQEVYTVKKGKLKAESYYSLLNNKVELKNYTNYTYKSGKVSKAQYATADGKYLLVATYKKGVIQKVVIADNDGFDGEQSQEVILFDKYGNMTSDTDVTTYKGTSYTTNTVCKNTYKNGKLVKVSSATAYSWTKDVDSALTVYTYKNGKLVKEVTARQDTAYPGYTWGTTNVYAYTKGGLIKTMTSASTRTTATETKVISSSTTAYQYQKVAVDKKCVKAVKAAVEDAYGYESRLPGGYSW